MSPLAVAAAESEAGKGAEKTADSVRLKGSSGTPADRGSDSGREGAEEEVEEVVEVEEHADETEEKAGLDGCCEWAPLCGEADSASACAGVVEVERAIPVVG